MNIQKVNFLNGYDVENIARAEIIVYAFSKGEHYTCFPELKCARKCVIIGITEAEEPSSSFYRSAFSRPFCVALSVTLSVEEGIAPARYIQCARYPCPFKSLFKL